MPAGSGTGSTAAGRNGALGVTSDPVSDELVVRGTGEVDAALRPA